MNLRVRIDCIEHPARSSPKKPQLSPLSGVGVDKTLWETRPVDACLTDGVPCQEGNDDEDGNK